MTLQQLAYVRAVVAARFNVLLAAQSIGLTQPGLSRQVLELERELGVDIFVRRRNRLISLTPVGETIHELGCAMLLQADGIRRAVRDLREPRSATLTIATTHTQARYALPPVVQAFARRYPSVTLKLRQGTPADAARMVASGTADLSIATAPLEAEPALAFLPCYELPRIVLTPSRHPLARRSGKRLTLEALAQYPLITYDYAFVAASKVLTAFAQRGLTPSIVLNAIDADVIKTYVELGMGIAIVPSLAFEARRDKGLCALPAGHLFEPNVIQLGMRKRDYLPAHARAFIALFAPHIEPGTIKDAISAQAGG